MLPGISAVAPLRYCKLLHMKKVTVGGTEAQELLRPGLSRSLTRRSEGLWRLGSDWFVEMLILVRLSVSISSHHRPLRLTERRREAVSGPGTCGQSGGGGRRRGRRGGNKFLTAPWKYLTTTITDREHGSDFSTR